MLLPNLPSSTEFVKDRPGQAAALAVRWADEADDAFADEEDGAPPALTSARRDLGIPLPSVTGKFISPNAG